MNAADPGAVFASDLHRRVLAFLPLPEDTPTTIAAFLLRLHADAPTPVDATQPGAAEQVEGVFAELAAEGYAEQVDGDLRMTPAGLEALNGPNGNEPPPLEGARLKAAELLDEELAKEEAAAVEAGKQARLDAAKAELAAAEEAIAPPKKPAAK